MTFCIGIDHDGPTPDLRLGDGTIIEATPESINRAVAAYLKTCREKGLDPAPEPRWLYDTRRETTHVATTQAFAPLWQYNTLCGLTLRTEPRQEILPGVATPALILHKKPCQNCLRIRKSRRRHEE